jgi:hypothetical protein
LKTQLFSRDDGKKKRARFERERDEEERTRENKKYGRLVPGRPLRRPHLRLGHGKWHFPRRRALVFVLSDEVCARENFFFWNNLTRDSFFLSNFHSALSLSSSSSSSSSSVRNFLADLFSLPLSSLLSFPLRATKITSQNVSREENRPLPSFPPETFVQKDT